MPHVAALYRYPIKGFEPERLDRVRVQPDGRIEGDRVLTFRYASALEPGEQHGLEHWPKGGGLCVRDYPMLTRLGLEYVAPSGGDDSASSAGRVRLWADGAVLVEAGLAQQGRRRLAAAVTDFLLAGPDGARLRRAGHLPLSVLGDGLTARFQDRARGYVTAHSRASLTALEGAVGLGLDEVRFRSNIAIEGMAEWAEEDLLGTPLRVGGVPMTVHGPIVRCLATHANPATGRRDAPVMTTLTRTLGKPEPAFGVLLRATGPGAIAVGDAVEIG